MNKKPSTVRYWICREKDCGGVGKPACHWKKEKGRYYQKDLQNSKPTWELVRVECKCAEAEEVTIEEYVLELL